MVENRVRLLERRSELHETLLQEHKRFLRMLDVERMGQVFAEWRGELQHLWRLQQTLLTKQAILSEAVWMTEQFAPERAGQVARMLIWALQLSDETWEKLGRMPLGEVLSEVRAAYLDRGNGTPLPQVLAEFAEAVEGFEQDLEDVA